MEKSVGDHAVRHTSSQVMTFLIGWKKAEALQEITKRTRKQIGHILRREGLLLTVLKGRLGGKTRKGRKGTQLLR